MKGQLTEMIYDGNCENIEDVRTYYDILMQVYDFSDPVHYFNKQMLANAYQSQLRSCFLNQLQQQRANVHKNIPKTLRSSSVRIGRRLRQVVNSNCGENCSMFQRFSANWLMIFFKLKNQVRTCVNVVPIEFNSRDLG